MAHPHTQPTLSGARAALPAALAWLAAPLQAQDGAGGYLPWDAGGYLPWIVIAALVLLQTGLILVLQGSRIKYKRARRELQKTQRGLEDRIGERTRTLHRANEKLQEEVDRHQATEILLRETQEYLHSIINSMPSVLIGMTYEGKVTHWNAAATEKTGIAPSDALGQRIDRIYPELPVDLATIQDTIERGTAYVQENIPQGSGPEAGYSDLSIYPLIAVQAIGAVIRIDDITLRVRMENMMIQNEKMLSLGELAAGVAHEINNPLSTILHGIQNIHRRTASDLPGNRAAAERLGVSLADINHYLEDRRIDRFLEDIREAGERSANIVTNMLEFSRSRRSRGRVILADVIAHCVELSRNSLDLHTTEGIEHPHIVPHIDDPQLAVEGSSAEIQQVVLNLLRNAKQAFSTEDYGPPLEPTVDIRLYRRDDKAVIEVEDNGPGMSESVRQHIFEPFFTTKGTRKGTGLGLSVSYFIITEHHYGTIEVDSNPGQGTRFTIRLPLTDSN